MDEEELARLKSELPPEVYTKLVSILEISQGIFDTCPHCGEKLEQVLQVRSSVYGSCGCHLYRGFAPQSDG